VLDLKDPAMREASDVDVEASLRKEMGRSSLGAGLMVRRCRLTVSKPVLKAPLLSALETKM